MVTSGKVELKSSMEEVISKGLCTFCGACSGSCPYLVPYKGRMVLMDNCNLSEGQCYQYCPRTFTDMDAISQDIFGSPYDDKAKWETIREILIARSAKENIRGSSPIWRDSYLTYVARHKEGLIDKAILTRVNNEKAPEPYLASNANEVMQCAGSSYMACPLSKGLTGYPKEENFQCWYRYYPVPGTCTSKNEAPTSFETDFQSIT